MDTNGQSVEMRSINLSSEAINELEYEGLVGNWIKLYTVGVSSANAAVAAWLQFCSASLTLHTSQPRYRAYDREATRRAFVERVSKSENHCKEMLHLSTLAFASLVTILKTKELVKNYSRSTIEEQLITFLLILGQNLKNRAVSCFLCRSGETISGYFHNILQAVIILEEDYVQSPNFKQVQPIIRNSHRFYPFFKDCLGAIDGTYVRVKVSQVDAPRYRGRKDWPTQNVLAACTFDMKFTYVLAGWEGSASDARVLQSALTRDEPLLIPDGPHPSTPEDGSSLKSGGTSKLKQKRKQTFVAVMEDGYKSMAASIHELSMALVETGEKVVGAKFDVSQNTTILEALSELGLDEAYRVRCYMYLSSNPSKAAVVVAAPKELRIKLLSEIMASSGN